MITPENAWAWILAAALAISQIGNAIEKIIAARKIIKAPNDKQNERLNALEKWKGEVDIKLRKDNERLEAIEEGNRVSQRALLALLDHSIDGNNIEQMQHAKEALQTHLISR